MAPQWSGNPQLCYASQYLCEFPRALLRNQPDLRSNVYTTWDFQVHRHDEMVGYQMSRAGPWTRYKEGLLGLMGPHGEASLMGLEGIQENSCKVSKSLFLSWAWTRILPSWDVVDTGVNKTSTFLLRLCSNLLWNPKCPVTD